MLGIENCSQVSDAVLGPALASLKNMRFLSADSCTQIGPEVLHNIATHQSGLVDLFVNKCKLVDDTGVELVCRNCPKVRGLLPNADEC